MIIRINVCFSLLPRIFVCSIMTLLLIRYFVSIYAQIPIKKYCCVYHHHRRIKLSVVYGTVRYFKKVNLTALVPIFQEVMIKKEIEAHSIKNKILHYLSNLLYLQSKGISWTYQRWWMLIPCHPISRNLLNVSVNVFMRTVIHATVMKCDFEVDS